MPYLTPDTPPDDTRCFRLNVPNDITWVGIVKGALSELIKAYNFEEFGSATPEETAQRFLQMYDEFVFEECDMAACCFDNPPLTRITSDGVFQSSTDGGTTWADDPARDPRNQTTLLAPVAGEPTDTKCKAANNVVSYLEDAANQMAASLDNATDVAAVTVVIVGLLLLLGIVTGGLTFVLLAGLPLVVAGLTRTEFEAAFIEANWQDLTELFFCKMETNGRLVAGSLPGIMTEVEGIFGGGLNVGARWVNGLLHAMGEQGINNAATMQGGADRSCDAAECTFTWEWDLTSAVDVLIMPHPAGHDRGHWEQGVGWIADYYPGDDIRIADLQFIWGKSYNITTVTFYWHAENAEFSGIWKQNGTTSMMGFPNGDSDSSGAWAYDGSNPATQTDRFFLGAVFRDTNAENQVAILNKVRLTSTDLMSFPTGRAIES